MTRRLGNSLALLWVAPSGCNLEETLRPPLVEQRNLWKAEEVGGKWEESWITRPGDQGREKLFISLDRSPNEAKRDNNYKSLKRAFVDVVPNAEPFKNDRDGIILCWQPVVRLGTDRESLEWLPAAVVQKLDKQAIEKRYRAILAEYAPRV